MTKEQAIEQLKDLKAVYSGAVQAGEISIANMIKGGIDLIEKLQKENEEYKKFLEKTIKEYIPDYKLEELVNRYKNESFIPRVEVKKILEDRRK